MRDRRWYYFLPLVGTIFGIWYIHIAFYDVVYSDYIRLVNSYLPDVWDPARFLVPDVLTRIPLTYLGRIINTTFFHYSVTFDQIMGVLGLGLSGAVLAAYCIRRRIGAVWTAALMAVVFSLNKWEMLTNGSGWVHFFAFAGFYYHYLVLDRVLSGNAEPHDRAALVWLPAVLILGVAGQYCAVYTAVLALVYLAVIIRTRISEKRWSREYAGCLAALLIPFACYLLSNSFAVEDHAGMQDLPLIPQLLDTPMYFVRFLLKSLSSTVAGISYAESHFTSNAPYLALGILAAAAYLTALWFQYRYRLWERTVLPLILILSGGANHLLVLLARWSFLREDYGMSSRYALQFSAGVLGIVLTFALVWKAETAVRRTPDGEDDPPAGRTSAEESMSVGRTFRRHPASCVLAAAFTAMFLIGTVNDTQQELETAPYRKILCMERAGIARDFENRSDDELRANFEYRTSLPESGRAVRDALTILRENGWNVFHEE